jgi:hypothetical protein
MLIQEMRGGHITKDFQEFSLGKLFCCVLDIKLARLLSIFNFVNVSSTTLLLEVGTLKLATGATLISSLLMSHVWDGERGEHKMLLHLI